MAKTNIRGRNLRGALILAVGTCAAILHGCNGQFYLPDRTTYSDPAAYPFPVEQVDLASEDGTRLHGWLLRAYPGPARGTVLQFHGNAQNLTSHVELVAWLPAEGYNVFTFDYRGYGKSEGHPSREGIHQDANAAINFLLARPDIDRNRVIVLGQSLGGAIAVAALGEQGTRGVRGVIVDSSFATYIGMGNEVIGGSWISYPLAWLLLSNRHSPAHAIARLAPVPLLFLHSEADPVVPRRQGQALLAAAAPESSPELLTVSEPAHPTAHLPSLRAKVLAWIEGCLAGK